MHAYNTKFMLQFGLIARLRELAGTVFEGYLNQKEFFIATLQNLSENLMDLKRETLREECGRFLARVDEGGVTEEAIVEFKSHLDKLVSARDFAGISAGIAGSKELIKARISALQPLSIAEEVRKKGDRDKTAERLVAEAYTRLKFQALETQLAAGVSDPALDKLFTQARANVADYCCMYHVPLREDDTLTTFSLSRIDAVVGACFQLIASVRDIIEKRRR